MFLEIWQFQVFRDREGGNHLETTSQRVSYVADIRDNNLNLTCYSRLVDSYPPHSLSPSFSLIWTLFKPFPPSGKRALVV